MKEGAGFTGALFMPIWFIRHRILLWV